MNTKLYGLETEKDILPLVLINCDEDAAKIYELCRQMGSGEFILAAISGFHWNRDLSPWPCDPVFRVKTELMSTYSDSTGKQTASMFSMDAQFCPCSQD